MAYQKHYITRVAAIITGHYAKWPIYYTLGMKDSINGFQAPLSGEWRRKPPKNGGSKSYNGGIAILPEIPAKIG